LWVVILTALSITRTGVQALLVSAIHFILIVSTVVAVAPIATILAVVTVDLTIVAIDLAIVPIPIPVASPITLVVTGAIVSVSVSTSAPVPVLVISILIATLIIAVAILRLNDTVCRSKYSNNKCERQKSPANPFSKFFHIRHIRKSPLAEDYGNHHAFAATFKIVGFAGFSVPGRTFIGLI
jgi:hypothetical protein